MSAVAPSASIQEEIMAFLLTSPSPKQITAFQASDEAQNHLRELLAANQSGTLTPAERAELDEASQINHFFTLLKAKAHQTLRAS